MTVFPPNRDIAIPNMCKTAIVTQPSQSQCHFFKAKTTNSLTKSGMFSHNVSNLCGLFIIHHALTM